MPLYMKNTPSVWLHDSLQSCCARYYSGREMSHCLGMDNGSGKWYVSHSNDVCVMDCPRGNGKNCGGLATSVDLFDNPGDCCRSKLHWIKPEYCEVSFNHVSFD